MKTRSGNQEMTTQTQTPKKALKVELYEVTDENMLARLDSLEGHPRWYRRTPVQTITGEKIEVYHMPLDQNTAPESPGYLEVLLEHYGHSETLDADFLYYNWNR